MNLTADIKSYKKEQKNKPRRKQKEWICREKKYKLMEKVRLIKAWVASLGNLKHKINPSSNLIKEKR